MAYYRRCVRCGCSMDPAEGLKYPGWGAVCEDCAGELDREEAYRRKRSLSGERPGKQPDRLPGAGKTA